jgi:TRAP-type C4-dicarboxylate transport system permease large subunit
MMPCALGGIYSGVKTPTEARGRAAYALLISAGSIAA